MEISRVAFSADRGGLCLPWPAQSGQGNFWGAVSDRRPRLSGTGSARGADKLSGSLRLLLLAGPMRWLVSTMTVLSLFSSAVCRTKWTRVRRCRFYKGRLARGRRYIKTNVAITNKVKLILKTPETTAVGLSLTGITQGCSERETIYIVRGWSFSLASFVLSCIYENIWELI